MLTFLSPWFGLLAVPVIVAGLVALFRPGRALVVVGSLSLWRSAFKRASTAKKTSRRATLGWLLLLVGALSAVCALTQPSLQRGVIRRHVTLAIHAGVEYATPGGRDELIRAGCEVVDRLEAADRVSLLLPERPAGEWLSRGEARTAMRRLEIIPVKASDIVLAPAMDESQHTCHIGPGGIASEGPNVSVVSVSPAMAPVVIRAFDAVEVDSASRVFVGLTSTSDAEWNGTLRVSSLSGDVIDQVLSLGPGQAFDRTFAMPVGQGYVAKIITPDGEVVDAAYIARQSRPDLKLGLLGDDEPVMTRFAAFVEGATLVTRWSDADVVICNNIAPPSGKPAVVINPPSPPGGWVARESVDNAVLEPPLARWNAQDPVLEGVNPAGIAVKHLPLWRRTGEGTSPIIFEYDGGVVMTRTPDGQYPPRVYISFAISAENTNVMTNPSAILVLARAVDVVTPLSKVKDYSFSSPADLVGITWEPLVSFPRSWSEKYPAKGLYRDNDGRIHAVSLVGLGLDSVATTEDPSEQANRIQFPDGEFSRVPINLFVPLSLLAGICWINGWAVLRFP